MEIETVKRITYEEWLDAAQRRYGHDVNDWTFSCCVCHAAQSVRQMRAAGMPEETWGYSCIGGWIGFRRRAFGGVDGPGPCDYAGGGLFRLHPFIVEMVDGSERPVFAFADEVPRG